MDLNNFQPHRLLLLLPLARKYSKHRDVEEGQDEGAAGIGQDPVVDQDLGVAWFYGGDGVTQELATLGVGPVEAN